MPNNTTTNILVLDNSNQNNFNPIINNDVANHMANLTENQIAQRRLININDEEVREIIYTGVGNSLERDLRYYNLSGLDLSEIDNVGQNNRHMINFTGANLANVNFRGSYLENSTFDNANIENVDFRDSYLQNSTFDNVDVRDSDFSNSNLSHVTAGDNTSFTSCRFNGANVFGCNYQNWNMIGCNIENIVDLESSIDESSSQNSSQGSESDNTTIVSDSENDSDNDYGNGPSKKLKPNTAGTSNTGTSNLTYRG